MPARRRTVLALAVLAAAAPAAAPAPARAALPVVSLEVPGEIPNEPKVPGRIRMPGYEGRMEIEVRGQSSQRFPKKSFSVELARDAAPLGMPEDDDWVLYAPYNDKTLMRNVVAYRTAALFGRYAARTRFVTLRMDGRYHGVYVLAERLELGADRVDADALYEFTFPFQARTKSPSFRTPVKRRPIVWEDPERDDLTKRAAARLARPVRALERALYGGGSWRRLLDVPSAVDFALINELFKNEDGFHASTYLTLRDGRLHLGPIWDFDISMGNSDYGPSRLLKGWMLERRDWAERLYRDRRFADAMARRWRALRRDGLRRELLATVARAERELRGEVRRNFARWPVLDQRVWPNPVARGSHRAEMAFLRGWLKRRIGWIDRNVGRL